MARSGLRYLNWVRRTAYLWGVLPFACLASASAQSADGKSQVAAEALFKEGRTLSASGHISEACPKFEASLHLDPALGTLLNLAECYEKLGKTASAWAEYRDAIPLARAAGSKVRLDLATKHAAAFEQTPPPAPAAHSGSGQRTAAVVVGAVGVVGLGLGTLFGLQAKSAWSEAKSHCTAYPFGCGADGVGQQSSANSKATVSTVAFIAGGVALGVGAVLWLTAGSSKSDSVALGFGPGAAFVRETFQ